MGFTGSRIKLSKCLHCLLQDGIHREPDEAIKVLTLFAAITGWDSPGAGWSFKSALTLYCCCGRMGFTGSRVKPLLSLPASLMKGFEQALLTKVISTEVSSQFLLPISLMKRFESGFTHWRKSSFIGQVPISFFLNFVFSFFAWF